MADRTAYRCVECGTTVRRQSPPTRCPDCRREGSLRAVDADEDGPAENATGRGRWPSLLVVTLGLLVLVTAVTGFYPKTPEGYVDGDGEQAVILGDPLNRTEIEVAIHRYVNERRQERGLDPIAFDPALRDIAREHSRDMIARDYFYHVSPDGQTVADRYRAAGYDCEIRLEDRTETGDENIFVTYAGEVQTQRQGTIDYEHNETKIARGVVDWWLNSTGHREVVLRPYWRRQGVGVVIDSTNETGTRVMVTQNLC